MKPFEAPITKALFSMASVNTIPLSATFELSPICNFNCRMCYIRKSPEEVKKHERSILKLEEWIRIAESMREKGTLYVLLTGGEPLLWPDFWTLYERLIKMGFLVSINTNGSLIDSKVIQKFIQYPPVRLNITLYGAGDDSYYNLCGVKNAYDKVIEGILELKKAGITIKLNCSMTPQNEADFDKIAEFAQQQNLILDATPYMYPPIRRNEEMVGINDRFSPEEAAIQNLRRIKVQEEKANYIRFLYDLLKNKINPIGLDESCIDPLDGKVRCRAGKASFWITWDGYMLPCGMMTEPRVDIFKGFENAWNETVINTQKIRMSGLCEKCESHEICHSCAAMALAESGSFEGIPVYLCEMVKAMKQQAEKELKAITNSNKCI